MLLRLYSLALSMCKPAHKPDANLLIGEPINYYYKPMISYYYKPMDQHYDEYLKSAQKATDKGKLMKLLRFQKISSLTLMGFIGTTPKLPTTTYRLGSLSSLARGPQPALLTKTTPADS